MSIRFPNKVFLVLLFAMLVSVACSVPFLYESPSLFYKTGLEKIMLRVGKIAGIAAVLLIIIQLLYVSRLPWFEKMVSRRQAYNYHRKSGLIILAAAWTHPVLILGADHFVLFPFESRYWPEFAGVVLLVILTVSVLVSVWQKQSGLSYETWRRVHLGAALVILVLIPIHAINVSRSFESGPPLWGILTMVVAGIMMLVYRHVRR